MRYVMSLKTQIRKERTKASKARREGNLALAKSYEKHAEYLERKMRENGNGTK